MRKKGDIVVIGGGLAGIYFAMEASAYAKVHVYMNRSFRFSNSYAARGGIAVAIGAGDSIEEHIKDTLVSGDGLCNENAVRKILYRAPATYQKLKKLGIQFDEQFEEPELGREGGHSANRIIHIKDETGRYLMEQMYRRVSSEKNINIYEGYQLLDLNVGQDGVAGVRLFRHTTEEVIDVETDTVVLATGGCGQLFRYNTNPPEANGEGVAIASSKGVGAKNMRFIQFHPTALYLPYSQERYLITEALRGAGAFIQSNSNEDCIYKYHPSGSLAPRDIVSRAMYREMQEWGMSNLTLNTTAIPRTMLEEDFPGVIQMCKETGIDIDSIPVIPAAHYMCGGIDSDIGGKTTLPGLYTIGETACTGLHGANRLASNSLLETLVMAELAAEAIFNKGISDLGDKIITRPVISEADTRTDVLKQLMWDYFGIVRDKEGMDTGLKGIQAGYYQVQNLMEEGLFNADLNRLKNMWTTALLIAEDAIANDSAGCHYIKK